MTDNKHSLFPLLRRLWGHISRRRRMQLAALGALMLLGTAAELISLGLVLPFLGALTAPNSLFDHPWMQPIITGLTLTTPQQLLLPLTVLFCLAALLAGIVRFALLWMQTHLGNVIGVDLATAAFRRTLYQPLAVHSSRNSSEVVSVLVSKVHIVVINIIVPVFILIASTVVVIALLLFMFLVEPWITVIALFLFGGLYAIIARLSSRYLNDFGQRVTRSLSKVTQLITEGLGAIRDVLIGNAQETILHVFNKEELGLQQAYANIAVLRLAPRYIVETVALMLIGCLAYAMSTRSEGMVAAIPALGAMALAAQRLLPQAQQIYSSWSQLISGFPSLRDLLVLLEQPLPAHSSLLQSVPIKFEQELGLNSVHFRYNSHSPWVLCDIDLQIPRGSRIGFIGATGSGKSTLLDLLMGLITPTSGTLAVDGVVVNEVNYQGWQTHIAHVPQTIFLIDATITENIAFGIPIEKIDHERVRDAAARAQIAVTIESWPKGYDALVGERGVRLSGGQRQRIGIARALYKNADVLVFDEATSALDFETEAALVESIDSLDSGITMLIVAHRLSTLRTCTQVVEFANSKIARAGSYEELVANSTIK